jgi:hypothetical protein
VFVHIAFARVSPRTPEEWALKGQQREEKTLSLFVAYYSTIDVQHCPQSLMAGGIVSTSQKRCICPGRGGTSSHTGQSLAVSDQPDEELLASSRHWWLNIFVVSEAQNRVLISARKFHR